MRENTAREGAAEQIWLIWPQSRKGSEICSTAAALTLGLLDGFLRGLSDLCFAPQVLCASGMHVPFCLINAPRFRKIRSHVVIYSYETGREL